jgi:predicted RNase H-like HicB family nuclease
MECREKRIANASLDGPRASYNPLAVKIRVVLEYDAEAGAYAAYCPELPGCTSAGDTEEEAFQNIREAIELYLEPSGDVGKGGKVVEVVV